MLSPYSRSLVCSALLVAMSACHAADRASTSDAQRSAQEAMRNGDFAIAYCFWLPLARRGDADAQYALGWMYHNGYGLRIDDETAIYWWEKAAENKNPEAIMALAMLYHQGGKTVRKDAEKAVHYFMKAVAENDDEDARLMLQTMLGSRSKTRRALALGVLKENPGILGTPIVVTAERANVRAKATTKSNRVAGLVKGDQVIEFSREGDWVHIGIPEQGIVAWIHHSLVTAPAESAEPEVEP